MTVVLNGNFKRRIKRLFKKRFKWWFKWWFRTVHLKRGMLFIKTNSFFLLPCASFSTKRPISSVEFWGRQIFHPSNQFYDCLKKFEFSNFKNEIVRHSARRRSQNRFKIEFGRPQVFMFCLYVLGFQLFACWSCFRCVCCLNCQISFNQFSLN